MLRVSLRTFFKGERLLFIFGILMFLLVPIIAFHPWLENYYYQIQKEKALQNFEKNVPTLASEKNLSPKLKTLNKEEIIPILNPPFKLSIPSLGVTQLVYEGDDKKTLKKGVGHRPGTAKPGERGYSVLEGHRTPYVFLHLNKLKRGDKILLSSGKIKLIYEVLALQRGVYKKDLSILEKQPEDSRIILVTCEKPNNNYRILVLAKLWRRT